MGVSRRKSLVAVTVADANVEDLEVETPRRARIKVQKNRVLNVG